MLDGVIRISMKNKYNVIVIGGGASGMMAAGRAASLGKKVLLLEKNKYLGEKLKISGGGRCNILNAEESERLLLANYGDAKQFLFSTFFQFGMRDAYTFFEERKIPLSVQQEKRTFPRSEKALDVVRALEEYIQDGRVDIRAGANVTNIIGEDGHVQSVVVNKKEYQADSYILATGGKSHPETGSTGDGFAWLVNLGHKVKDPTPAIVPLAVKEAWVKSLAGVSLDSMKITFSVDGKNAFKKKGKLLFTHFGISGPLILNSAVKVSDLLHEGEVKIEIDAYPGLNLDVLDKQITKVFDNNKNKMFKNIVKEIVPPGTSEVIISLLSFDANTEVHSITKIQRKEIVNLLKGLPATITGLMGEDRAVITDGGLALNEIDGKTMRSRLYDNLFVTGDLLDINRPSGGFSLQLCWTTGFVAGSNA